MKFLYADLPHVSIAGKTLVARVVFALLVFFAATAGAIVGLLIVYSTDLPEVAELERYRPGTVTELYDDNGRVIGSFALQRRVIAAYEDLPKVLRDAVLSIEDKDFETHWGIDLKRVLGAAYEDIRTRSNAQGASTLTMQLSRNLFLSPDRTLTRKAQEAMLAMQIERRFTKPQIFTMYSNQIYLGHGVYGFEAGAQYYFGKSARELTLSEAAVLAALPKSPAQYSPITRAANLLRRRNLVINSMLEDGRITLEQANLAKAQPVRLNLQATGDSIAPHFVEEVRQYLEKKFGAGEVHEGGLRVYTTLNREVQRAAERAAIDGLAAYERRRGWRGQLRNILQEGHKLTRFEHPDWKQQPHEAEYMHALVTSRDDRTATLKIGKRVTSLTVADIAWTGGRSPKQLLKPGDLVFVRVLSASRDGRIRVALEQETEAQAAVVVLDNVSGEIKAMVGGRDFTTSKFNRATQALRQVGSSFKPYVYTAALDAGVIKPDDFIVDEPITFPGGSGPYTPSNYDSRFWGRISLRTAVADSRNIPALKVANEVGIPKVIDTARRFGITSRLPEVLPLALGAAEVTLLEQTAAFATFPNDGVRVGPRMVRKVTDYDGHIKEETFVEVRDVISATTARNMVTLLQGVVNFGSATAARRLHHPLAGKTGTTNDFTDAWFVGFSPSITCGVWVGFDEKRSLGPGETGGKTALPIWINVMGVALAGREKEAFSPAEQEKRSSSASAAPATSVAAVPRLRLPEPKAETKSALTKPPGVP